MSALSSAILTLLDGLPTGWHVVHQDKDPQIARDNEKPWVVAFYRNGKLGRVAERFEVSDYAEDTLNKWEDEAAYEREFNPPPDARDSALDPHGPWGAP
jgi:hypothetical protein